MNMQPTLRHRKSGYSHLIFVESEAVIGFNLSSYFDYYYLFIIILFYFHCCLYVDVPVSSALILVHGIIVGATYFLALKMTNFFNHYP